MPKKSSSAAVGRFRELWRARRSSRFESAFGHALDRLEHSPLSGDRLAEQQQIERNFVTRRHQGPLEGLVTQAAMNSPT